MPHHFSTHCVALALSVLQHPPICGRCSAIHLISSMSVFVQGFSTHPYVHQQGLSNLGPPRLHWRHPAPSPDTPCCPLQKKRLVPLHMPAVACHPHSCGLHWSHSTPPLQERADTWLPLLERLPSWSRPSGLRRRRGHQLAQPWRVSVSVLASFIRCR